MLLPCSHHLFISIFFLNLNFNIIELLGQKPFHQYFFYLLVILLHDVLNFFPLYLTIFLCFSNDLPLFRGLVILFFLKLPLFSFNRFLFKIYRKEQNLFEIYVNQGYIELNQRLVYVIKFSCLVILIMGLGHQLLDFQKQHQQIHQFWILIMELYLSIFFYQFL